MLSGEKFSVHDPHHKLYCFLIFLQKSVSSDIVERMTDTSLYTGSHKHRFDEEGKGKGLEGRDSIAKGKGMVPGSVSSQTAYVSGYKGDGKYTSSPKSSPKPKAKVTKLVDRQFS